MRTLAGSGTASLHSPVLRGPFSLGAGQRARHHDRMHSSAGSGISLTVPRSINLSAGRRVRQRSTSLDGSEMFRRPFALAQLRPRAPSRLIHQDRDRRGAEFVLLTVLRFGVSHPRGRSRH